MPNEQPQTDLWGQPLTAAPAIRPAAPRRAEPELPPNLGKPWKDCRVPDFNDPDRPKTCLETDFPIAQINALSQLEGNAGKPIYQMGKWWARRRSSVFRSLLIAAAAECPDDPSEAAKTVWEHYYCNHQKGGAFSRLKVLEPFMGGGTTVVEGSRLGMQMTGIDLNPVAWFVCKNELSGSDPAQVEALFREIEAEVKPQIQPFYATSCPRGHKGRWIDVRTGESASVDPVSLPPAERGNYRWEGPEVVYTFWAKHGPCSAAGCGHRTPLFKSPVIAQKTLTARYLELTCPSCGQAFHAELGESRMAPGAELQCQDAEVFTTLSQPFAELLDGYDRLGADAPARLRAVLDGEEGLRCPHCRAFAGRRLADVLARHAATARAQDRKKKEFGIQKKKVNLWLVLSPDWLRGSPDAAPDGSSFGGSAGSDPAATARWNAARLEDLSLVEVRSKNEPETIRWQGRNWAIKGTVPRNGHFVCGHCGKEHVTLDAVRPTGATAPASLYALQCHCPECEKEGYNYNGRFFKIPDDDDIRRLDAAEREWSERAETDLAHYWPRQEVAVSFMTHKLNGGIPNWGYTHWWKMFNSRQLLVHTQLLRAIAQSTQGHPLDVSEQVLGAFQQFLRNESMFCFWDSGYDKIVPMLSNSNFHPKNNVVENCVFTELGRGNVASLRKGIAEGLAWEKETWDAFVTGGKSIALQTGETIGDTNSIFCGSSTDLSFLGDERFDLVITDPPFGNNLFYADLSEFFYVWLRIPLLKWYEGQPEADWFRAERTPHSTEAVDNSVEHPDDREDWEKEPYVTPAIYQKVREAIADEVSVGAANPLFRPTPSSEFYSQTLAACWAEAASRLKQGGLMAFTFHHNDDGAWIDVLRALFESGYVLVATYPIRSDETKGDSGAFGSRKIEYDVIHVCRKRLADPEPVSYAKMRRFVREEAGRLKALLETVHGRALPAADLRVILRGKSLEFYSRHYGAVMTGTGEVLEVRDALLGINQILDDILEDEVAAGATRPPESAEPVSRLYLRIFRTTRTMQRDQLHKTLQGSGISQKDLEARGWISVVGREVTAIAPIDRYREMTKPGRVRKLIRTDLDQAFFLMGLVLDGRSVKTELSHGTLKLKNSVPDILKWLGDAAGDTGTALAARNALSLLEQYRAELLKEERDKPEQLQLFDPETF